ncbi:MAG: energy-coupling factor transporter transmembrane protein EcfT, partial [Clostridia bacterium]
MLKNITLGQYYPGDSALHRLDPRMKILLTIVYIAVVFFVKGVVGYALLAAFLLCCTRIARIRVGYLLRGLKPLLFIIGFTAVLNLFFTPAGRVIWKWGFIQLTEGGIKMALFFAGRLVFLVLGTSLLTLTTSPIALTDGIERLLSPLRIFHFPAHELAM